ncbi:hypothetical protein CJ179_38330 [Rhodococcus sp. ACS1]|uniref:hypothetical protein n=1 Tax=Rhodococcus sp. ACS1 TaxID=2028570 RepID=UPI000BB10859|nr:hypothetical protein [Rhodococcus sp. ACS1]PBC38466.1 hypothetical protein CJ179_38330 [Rhodococcus sp. ACS1]
MDLLDFFRGVYPWPKLYRILSRLPEGSEYRADQALDTELAEEYYAVWAATQGPDQGKDGEDKKPQLRSSSGYSMQIQVLMAIADLIQQLNSTLIAVNLPKGKKPPKVRPMPRPVSAFDLVRARHEKDEVDNLLSILLPN